METYTILNIITIIVILLSLISIHQFLLERQDNRKKKKLEQLYLILLERLISNKIALDRGKIINIGICSNINMLYRNKVIKPSEFIKLSEHFRGQRPTPTKHLYFYYSEEKDSAFWFPTNDAYIRIQFVQYLISRL